MDNREDNKNDQIVDTEIGKVVQVYGQMYEDTAQWKVENNMLEDSKELRGQQFVIYKVK